MASARVRGRPIAPLVLSTQERAYLEFPESVISKNSSLVANSVTGLPASETPNGPVCFVYPAPLWSALSEVVS